VTPPAVPEIMGARRQITDVIRYLRGGRDDELHLIEADLAFEMGALHAIDWILGLAGGEWFLRHLAGLKSIEHKLRGE
jgi:hypothetical protein